MFESITALYVEDEEHIRDIVTSIFENMFENFFVAHDGKEGLELFSKHKDKIDIVITDINMPRMNGLEMSQEIRELNQTIPIIITTAYNDNEFLHQAIKMGISDFVTKPLDIKDLLNSVKKSINHIILQKELESKIKQHQEERVKSARFTAIGQLAAGITHEINTPLTYIKATFEMMEEDIKELPESSTKNNVLSDIGRINNGLHRIENIISSMKEMSSQSKVIKENTDIYYTINTAIVLAYNKIKHISNVYINDELFILNDERDTTKYMVDIQPQRIEQVWVIIINNAMDELVKKEKFEDRRLDIYLTQTNDEVVVIFKDNAGGIKDKLITNIFEPFKGSKKSSGMGIGLSIAKKIVDDHDAVFNVYNDEEGAVFEVRFKK